MTDYSDYVHCGEVFRSSILSNEKPYLFKCIKCRDLFRLEAFLAHFEQNVCELREITIKEEVLDDGCLSGLTEKGKNYGINSNRVNKIEVNQDSLVFIKDEDVSIADEKEYVRCKIDSNYGEVDAEQQELETEVIIEYNFDLDDDNNDGNDSNAANKIVNLDNEEETISNLIDNYDNAMALIGDSKAQTPLWNGRPTIRDKEQNKKCFLATLGPHLPSLLQEQIVQILKIYENLPHLWNTSLIEHRCKNKRCESEMKMIKRIEATLGYKIDCETLKKYLKSIHLYTLQEKFITQSTGCSQNSVLYQHLVFLLDHVGPFQCSKCDFENHSIYIYKVHLSQHDGSMPFKCSQCGMEFNSMQSYHTHAKRHLEALKYICQVCDRKFLTFQYLHRHTRTHTVVRNHVCKTCGKAFKLLHKLRTHEHSHSGVRKFVCSICNKSFKLGSYLTQHMRIHGRYLIDQKITTNEDKMADNRITVKNNLNEIS